MKQIKQFSIWLMLCIIILTGTTGTVHAHNGCGFDAYHHAMMQDSAYASNYHAQQQVINNYLSMHNNPNARIAPGGCDKPLDMEITMPVVIHVIHLGEPVGTGNNISRSQIDSAMARLNRDFKNVNGFGPDTKMRFVLAKRDPNGNATTGINRIDGRVLPNYQSLGVTNINMLQIINLSRWDVTKYINVYVVTNFEDNIIGYYLNNSIFVKNIYFSENWRTFAHEMGHYFDLYHTFSENGNCASVSNCNLDGDKVCDTPPYKLGETPGTGSVCYNGDISNSYYNIMGSTIEKNRFTTGQKDRMRAYLYTKKWSLVMSDGLIPVTVTNEVSLDAIENVSTRPEMGFIPEILFCNGGFVPKITLRNLGTNTVNTATVQTYVDGVLKNTTNLSGLNISAKGTKTINLNTTPITAGIHTIKCVITRVNGVADYLSTNNEVCGDIEFYTENYEVAIGTVYPGVTVSGWGLYPCNTQVSVNTSSTNPQYEFVSWTDSYSGQVMSTVPNYSFIVNENTALDAVYRFVSQPIITVSSANPSMGTVFGGGVIANGSSITVQAFANACHTFSHWSENGTTVSTSTSYTFTVSGDRNLVANFSLQTFTVNATASPALGGTVFGTGVKNCNSVATISATPSTGYNFLYWKNDAGETVSSKQNYSFTVNGNSTLTAFFELKAYNVSILTNGPAMGTINVLGSLVHGTVCTVSIQANPGYQLKSITENGVVVSTDTLYTFTITGDKNFVIEFESVVTPVFSQKTESIIMYPNPTTDWVMIQNMSPEVMVTVCNSAGVVVLQQPLNDRLSVGHLPGGLYIVKIIDDKKLYIGKFLKQ